MIYRGRCHHRHEAFPLGAAPAGAFRSATEQSEALSAEMKVPSEARRMRGIRGMLLSCAEQESNQRNRHREGAVCRAAARQSRPSLCTHPGRIAGTSQHLIALSGRTKMFRFLPCWGRCTGLWHKKRGRKTAPFRLFNSTAMMQKTKKPSPLGEGGTA